MEKWRSKSPVAANAVDGFSGIDHLAGWIKSEANSDSIVEQERVLTKAHDIVSYAKTRIPLRNLRKGALRKLIRHRVGCDISNAEADRIVMSQVGSDDLAFMTARAIGRLIRLTVDEWLHLQIRTIHPYDITFDQIREIQSARRVAKRSERSAKRREARRRKGAKPRQEYEAQAAKNRALIAESGVSRATFYRRQKTQIR